MKDLNKLFGKKEEPSMSEGKHKEAMKAVIKQMMEQALAEMMNSTGSDVEGIKKVSVMAPDQEGLEEGLEKAKEVVDEIPEDEELPEMDSEEEDEEELKKKKFPFKKSY